MKKYVRDSAAYRLMEEKLYEQVYEELASGSKRGGLWAKSLATNQGDETKAKATYIELRVQSILDEIEVTDELERRKILEEEEIKEKKNQGDIQSNKEAVNLLECLGYSVHYLNGIWTVAEKNEYGEKYTFNSKEELHTYIEQLKIENKERLIKCINMLKEAGYSIYLQDSAYKVIGYADTNVLNTIEDLEKYTESRSEFTSSKADLVLDSNKEKEKGITIKRPIAITIVCIIGFIGVFVSVPYIFEDSTKTIIAWYPAFLTISVITSLVSFIAMWKMKKIGAYLYAGLVVISQFVLLGVGVWRLGAILTSGVIAAIALYYSKDMN